MQTMFGDEFFNDLFNVGFGDGFGSFGFGSFFGREASSRQQQRALMNGPEGTGSASRGRHRYNEGDSNINNQMSIFSPNAMFLNPDRMFREIDELARQTETRMNQWNGARGEDGSGSTNALAGRNGGIFHSQVMMMSSSMGPDGKVQTRRYAHCDRGDLSRGVREVREAYEDPTEQRGMHFRQLHNRAHRVHKRRDAATGHVDTTDHVHGFDRSQLDAFQTDWTGQAVPHLPSTRNAFQAALPHYQEQQQQALPAAPLAVNSQPYAGQQTPYVQEEVALPSHGAASTSHVPGTRLKSSARPLQSQQPQPGRRVYYASPPQQHPPQQHPPQQHPSQQHPPVQTPGSSPSMAAPFAHRR